MVSFQCEGVEMPELDLARVSKWLTEVASDYDKVIGNVTYRFCDDETILATNRDFLDHNYYTDIITFDYTVGRKIGGDILISLDTVASNAEEYGVTFADELLRVIVHGVLHLCGLHDKSVEQRADMEAAENKALELYKTIR